MTQDNTPLRRTTPELCLLRKYFEAHRMYVVGGNAKKLAGAVSFLNVSANVSALLIS